MNERCLTVIGGSIGARSINLAAFAAFAEGNGEVRVIHVSGRRDYAELEHRWREAGPPRGYMLLDYEPDLGDVLAASDLVLARAGGSVMEIAAAGRPAVLVPYPRATGDHQEANARWMAEGGAAVVIPDAELDPGRSLHRGRRPARRPQPARGHGSGLGQTRSPRCRRANRCGGAGGGPGFASGGRVNWSRRRLHFVAIGGAGMSGLALVCHRLGARVSGSDRAESSYIERLRASGLEPRLGHDRAQVPADAEVIVSTAISDDNPELAIARERGQRVLHRGELLAELCAERRLLAVAGTHGKTTTTAMCVHALRASGADPSFFLGGELPGAGPGGEPANAGWGEGEWVIAEADESDASFLELRPEVAVVTNIELDHHSRWGSLAELAGAFARFAAPASELVRGAEVSLPPASHAREIRFALEPEPGAAGPAPEADLLATGIEPRLEGASRFRARGAGIDAEVTLAVPGRHNVANALCAIGALAGTAVGADGPAVGTALGGFPGVARRLERKGSHNGAAIYDDYAHHPTEVRASLEAARELGPRRLIAAFQPHLYSRTKALASELGAALAAADEIAVLDVYPAREKPVGPLEGVSGLMVAEAAAERAGGRPVWWLPDADAAAIALAPRLGEGDLLVTIGAGDIYKLAEALAGGGVRS